MKSKKVILTEIKNIVQRVEPDATIILFGSYARGEQNINSDIDLLILINKEKMTWEDEKRITYPLYNFQFMENIPISPVVKTKTEWELKFRNTDFYLNINDDGIQL